MYVWVCADSQYVQPQRATADNAFPTIFCAFCASMERLSRALFFCFYLLFYFFLRSTRTRALCAGNKFDSLRLENIVGATPRYTKRNEKFVSRKKITWENAYLGSRTLACIGALLYKFCFYRSASAYRVMRLNEGIK